MEQLSFFKSEDLDVPSYVQRIPDIELLPLEEYDHIIVSMSGGKDSMACLFHLLNVGVPTQKLELWHQCVDGRGEQYREFVDWPVTELYIEAVGKHFGIPTHFQWRDGGFHRELMRSNERTGDVYYTEGNAVHCLPTKQGKLSTRRKWPAVSPDLRVRWCSPYLKIDVFRRVLNNSIRFLGKNVLVITGERREESANRARYAEKELHSCHSSKRLVHAWRPVINWTEEQVWAEFRERKFHPHPAYLLGFNRCSCFSCIFADPSTFTVMGEIAPKRLDKLIQVEKEIDHTIDPKRVTIEKKVQLGSLSKLPNDPRVQEWVQLALGHTFDTRQLTMKEWIAPFGAFKGGCDGPN